MVFGPVPGKGKRWSRSTAGPLLIMAGGQGHSGETGGKKTRQWIEEQVICGRRLDNCEGIHPSKGICHAQRVEVLQL